MSIHFYVHHPALSTFFDDRRKTRRIPETLLDLGFSALPVPLESLAAELGLGVWLPRPLSGVAGVEVGLRRDGRFELGGVELNVASAAAETLPLAGVDTDVVVVLLGPVMVVMYEELFCALTRRAFPTMPCTHASFSGLVDAGEPEVAARVLVFLIPPFGPAAPRGV